MKLVSYVLHGTEQVGVIGRDTGIVSLSRRAPALPRSLRGLLAAGGEALSRAGALASEDESDHALAEVELLPVIPDPPAVWCVGVNYDDHRQETGREPSKYPTLFLRIAASHAVETAERVTRAMNTLGGGSAIYTSSSLQRHARDAEAVTHHFTVAPHTWEESGRVLLGREPIAAIF